MQVALLAAQVLGLDVAEDHGVRFEAFETVEGGEDDLSWLWRLACAD